MQTPGQTERYRHASVVKNFGMADHRKLICGGRMGHGKAF